MVFPEMPIQTSIFPLGLMMDCLVGLWERLKKMVVRGRRNAMYLEINLTEISHMYHSNNKNYGTPGDALMDEHGFEVMEECNGSKHDDILLSLDGVHPNKKLYRKWAELVGRKLYVRIHRQGERLQGQGAGHAAQQGQEERGGVQVERRGHVTAVGRGLTFGLYFAICPRCLRTK